jgi:hypothetical protein
MYLVRQSKKKLKFFLNTFIGETRPRFVNSMTNHIHEGKLIMRKILISAPLFLLVALSSNAVADTVVSGRVTAADSGLPLANTAGINFFDDTGTRIGTIDTDINGEYSIEIPSGNYWIHVDAWGVYDHYVWEFHDNTPCPQMGTCGDWLSEIPPIDLTAPNVSFDAALALGIVLEGSIVEEGIGDGIESSQINFFATDGSRLSNPSADADGYFRTTALPAGDYLAFTEAAFLGTGFLDEIYQDISCKGQSCWDNVVTTGTVINATNPGDNYSITVELGVWIFKDGFEASD